MQMRKFSIVMLTFAIAAVSQTVAQTSEDSAALEARMIARMERRLAEQGTETKGQYDALRIAVTQTIETMAKSNSDLERKVLLAMDKGATKEGLDVLEQRANARDAAATHNAASATAEAGQNEAKNHPTQWPRIYPLALLDNTDRAIEAYPQRL